MKRHSAQRSMPTKNQLLPIASCGKATPGSMDWIPDESVHLVVTSPPYWTLKKYNDHPDQLGDIDHYEAFMDELDKVWSHCYRALVQAGGLRGGRRMYCEKAKRRSAHGRTPPCGHFRALSRIGYDYLTPILWYKIANASYEIENGSSFLGKPFEPNAIIKNDIEYVLMLRKHGAYRKPTETQRNMSRINKEDHGRWFRSIWSDVPGASTQKHPAPFPVELATRLVRMFSFVGDTVLDPFAGTGTTLLAAVQNQRNAIGVEIDPAYCRIARQRLTAEFSSSLFTEAIPVRSRIRRRKVEYSSASSDCGAGGMVCNVAGCWLSQLTTIVA